MNDVKMQRQPSLISVLIPRYNNIDGIVAWLKLQLVDKLDKIKIQHQPGQQSHDRPEMGLESKFGDHFN